MKYQAKNNIIEAVRWTWTDYPELREFAEIPARGFVPLQERSKEDPRLFLDDPYGGTIPVEYGDYVVRMDGELHPCKASLFEALFRPIRAAGSIGND